MLHRLSVELLVFLKTGDVSLLLQVLGHQEDVFLRGFVWNHARVCLSCELPQMSPSCSQDGELVLLRVRLQN